MKFHLSRDSRARPFGWLLCAAAVTSLSYWYLLYFDAKFIGPVDDRIAFVYGGMMPWWAVGTLSGAIAFAILLKRLRRPMRVADLVLLFTGAGLVLISSGPVLWPLGALMKGLVGRAADVP
jgi:hypothetical protein